MDITNVISQITSLTIKQVKAIISLLDEGATVPFISRYRKERTDSANEVEVEQVKNEYERLSELEKRKTTIIKSIESQEKLTNELKKAIEECYDNNKLEDIYLPYKPKRRTRAMIARERGAEPLAKEIFNQKSRNIDSIAQKFINDDLPDIDSVMAAANDIIAEWINEDSKVRDRVRKFMNRSSKIKSKVVKSKEDEGAKYSDYFEFEGQLSRQPSHRILAILRAEKEGFLKISLEVDGDEALDIIDNTILRRDCSRECKEAIQDAATDSFKRLIKPSLDTELLSAAKERADREAIDVFAQNLRQLLLSAPLGSKNILAIDPGYRTGCKVVCLSRSGELLHNETIYPHEPQNESSLAMKKISSMVESYKIEAIAIGDGTASRPTEQLIKRMNFNSKVEVYVVSEDGASVYSASAVAREEFPQYDVTVRGAVSIGRRLMDPLSELVKIDPKSIGVGQYQHDVEQNMLKKSLDSVVESCVNSVGVNLNTASYHLLSYVSGIGSSLSKKIIEYRAANGDFSSRNELLKVPRLGAKVFEQCAGFLRIKGGENPLDSSAVHPESYGVVDKMAKDLNCKVEELITNSELRKKIVAERYITPEVGILTIKDIISELEKPGLDPREQIEMFEFAEGIYSIENLNVGMVLPGIVTNITNFGAFVDVGVKQDGLVHISQLADKFVSNPNDIVKLHQKVMVRVTEVDMQRKRIQLTMKGV